MDSTITIQMINSGKITDMNSVSLVKQIMRLLEMLNEVKVSHTYKEANFCKDALAQLGASSGEDLIFFEKISRFLLDI